MNKIYQKISNGINSKSMARVISGLLMAFVVLVSVASITPDLSYGATQTWWGASTNSYGVGSSYYGGTDTYGNNGIPSYAQNGVNGGVSGGYSGSTPKNLYELIMGTIVGGMLRPITYLIITLAIVIFLWGVFKFIRAEGDDKQSGRDFMLWGIIGLFVMLSVWGLVNVLRNTFNLNDATINIPHANL